MTGYLIRPVGSRYYHARIKSAVTAKWTTLSLRSTTKQVAQKKLQNLCEESERESAGILPPKILREAAQKPVLAHLDEMLTMKASNRDERYLAELKAKITRLCKDCGWTVAASVTAESFQLWQAKRQQDHVGSPKTLNEYLIAIRSLLNWMVTRGRLTHSPLVSVELLPVHKKVRPRRALTDDELERLTATPRGLLYLFAAYTGLRYGEIAAVRVDDVKLDAAFVLARAETTKNGEPAQQPLHPDLVTSLRAYIQKLGLQPDDLLFGEMSRKHFPKDAAAAGIALVADGLHVGFHSLRHTFCSRLQRGGVSQRVLMQLMRHSDRRLSDHLYTDAALLPTRESIQGLPNFAGKLSHILSHDLVPSSPNESRSVPQSNAPNPPSMLINRGSGHDESRKVLMSPKWGKMRDTGFEPVTPAVSRQCSTTELTARLKVLLKTKSEWGIYEVFVCGATFIITPFRETDRGI